MPDAPGLGIENLEDDVMREHLHPDYTDMWAVQQIGTMIIHMTAPGRNGRGKI